VGEGVRLTVGKRGRGRLRVGKGEMGRFKVGKGGGLTVGKGYGWQRDKGWKA
jgi:hypothetical protein